MTAGWVPKSVSFPHPSSAAVSEQMRAEPGEEKALRYKPHGHPITGATFDLSRLLAHIQQRLKDLALGTQH